MNRDNQISETHKRYKKHNKTQTQTNFATGNKAATYDQIAPWWKQYGM